MKPTRPVLRYHGGKWRLAPWIISHFPAHRVYVEPFGGAASVLLRKSRSYAEVYNDLDAEVVNVFRVLRDADRAAALERALRLTPFARSEFAKSYEPCADATEQARRTIFRSFAGFGSAAVMSAHKTGFRSNVTRSGTTPAQDWHNYPSQIQAFVERLRGVVIESAPAADVVKRYDSPETLHYADPPYPHETRTFKSRPTGRVYRFEMTSDDHRTLAAGLHAASGMVAVSGYACELYDNELYPDWHRVTKATHADSALDRTEVLWLNPACASALESAA